MINMVTATLDNHEQCSEVDITGVASLEKAVISDLSFLEEDKHLGKARSSKAGAIILKKLDPSINAIQLIHPKPKWAFSKIANYMISTNKTYKGISEKASISRTAHIGRNVSIHPFVVIEDSAWIGDNTEILPHTYLGKGVKIGSNTTIKSNVSIETGTSIGNNCLIHSGTTIGADGFGFTPGSTSLEKFPQLGGVIIEDDVEVGACCTVDCGALHDTKIGKGTKLDSHVHIAHNADIGEHVMLCGGSAIAGSSKLGNHCIIGGASAVKDHVELSDGVILGGYTAAIGNIKKPGIYVGFPATEHENWKKQVANVRLIESLKLRIQSLEQKLSKR